MLDFTASNTANVPPAITAAAGFVAGATARFNTANAALAKAEATDRQVRDRIDALTAERQAIVMRRARGMQEDGDAARIALLDADLEGLASIVGEADSAVSAERVKVEAEQRLVEQANAQLARAEDEAALAALVEHAKKLDALLVTTLTDARHIYLRLGVGKPPFAPSPALVLELRKVAAAHGLL